jgi:hypothetical protein
MYDVDNANPSCKHPQITQRGLGRKQIIFCDVTPQIQNQERSDCTLESSRSVSLVFFSLACSRFAPGSVVPNRQVLAF